MAEDKYRSALPEADGPPIWAPKSCTAGRRLFLGFARARLERVLDGLGERILGPPHLATYCDVMMQPLRRLAPRCFAGGVYQDGQFIDALALRRGTGTALHQFNEADVERPIADAAPAAYLPRAWFGGLLFNHYGHFLLDGLARILGEEVRSSSDPVLFLNPRGIPKLADWMVGVLCQCGFDPARVILCDVVTAVDELRVQEPSFVVRDSLRPGAYVSLPRWPAEQGDGMLYLSRGNPRLRRRIVGEEQLEEKLASERQARLLVPETLPVPAPSSPPLPPPGRSWGARDRPFTACCCWSDHPARSCCATAVPISTSCSRTN